MKQYTDALHGKHKCPHCGHPTMPRDPLAFLSPVLRELFRTIYGSGTVGVTAEAIRDRMHGEVGRSRNNLYTSITLLNKRLPLIGMVVRLHGGRGGVYKVERRLEKTGGEEV